MALGIRGRVIVGGVGPGGRGYPWPCFVYRGWVFSARLSFWEAVIVVPYAFSYLM